MFYQLNVIISQLTASEKSLVEIASNLDPCYKYFPNETKTLYL